MYTNFFNLKEKPFDLTPSPRFLYLGETHKEALCVLTYGVMERKGFALLTGEVGTGKTTIVQAFLQDLDSSVKYVNLSNPMLSATDFLFHVACSVGLRTRFSSKGTFLIQFEDLLRKSFQDRHGMLLIVDEAHKLSFELLEEIRLLSNMETAEEKLINIFLVGQPELNEKLSQRVCRPLLQRIGIRYHIRPLDLKDTGQYIEARLNIAGAENGSKIFPKSVIEAIHRYSEGYPRVINILADNVLLLGYSKGEKKITPLMVKQSYKDMKLNGCISKSTEPYELKEGEQVRAGSYWKWAALFLVLIFAAAVMGQVGQNFLQRMTRFIPITPRVSPKGPPRQRLSTPNVQKEQKLANTTDIIRPHESKKMESTLRAKNEEVWKSTIVEQGDTFSKLLASVYGRVDVKTLDLVRKYNPQIEDIDRIVVGKKIIFPPLSTLSHHSTFTVHVASFKTLEPAQNLFQKLRSKGYEVHIIPAHDIQKGEVSRVTLGSFHRRQDADDYANLIIKEGLSDYAKTIHMD